MLAPVAIKVDVDTHDGMRLGVPVLLEELERMGGIKATFCLSFGPDNAGKAVFRLLRDPAFLMKMLRTRAPNLYGLRTILSGTLLPARPIASAFPDLTRRIRYQGHEVIVHAWDHRKWQDHLARMDPGQIRAEFKGSFEAFKSILGTNPRAVAAPGWQVTPQSLEVQDGLDLLYASDLRQGPPCFIKAGGKVFKTLQIPTTGPCIEELLAVGIKKRDQLLEALTHSLEGEEFPVLAVHAEVEGGPYRDLFRLLVANLFKGHKGFITLEEMAERILAEPEHIPVRRLTSINLPGRAGKVASSR